MGEPINPEIWRWYHDVVGDSRCAVVDTWWQTETGGILITPLPGVTPTKPGSATLPFFGVKPVVLDTADGKVLEGNGVSGALCLATPWPGQARTVWGDHQRFKETYFTQFPGYYFTGDGVRRDEDGYYWITGRIDDVLNVSGHRLGTAEIESALVAHEAVAEAAVVGFPHPIKGQGIYAYVLLTSEYGSTDREQLQGALKEQVRHAIGAFAAPDVIHIASGLPKTRSGKIMRRILRKIAALRVRRARRPQHARRAGGRGPAHPGAPGRPEVTRRDAPTAGALRQVATARAPVRERRPGRSEASACAAALMSERGDDPGRPDGGRPAASGCCQSPAPIDQRFHEQIKEAFLEDAFQGREILFPQTLLGKEMVEKLADSIVSEFKSNIDRKTTVETIADRYVQLGIRCSEDGFSSSAIVFSFC